MKATLFDRRATILLILSVAILTRLVGLDWALPHTYEEATPLRIAIRMWGWGGDGGISLNPMFFNYPSLMFYIHFLVQGIVFAVLQIKGDIGSALDWYVLYVTDPTPEFLAARMVGALCGVLTVFFTFKLGKRLAGVRVGWIAAVLVATNAYHVARSQMIEVDIALALFCTVALYGTVCIAERGQRRDYLGTAVAIGLASSSKYTGFLLFVPLVIAHLSNRNVADRVRSLRLTWLVLAMIITVAVFVGTSPYVLLDFQRFEAALRVEREHMNLGHFGTDNGSSFLFYLNALARLIGIPGIILSVGGVFWHCRNRPSRALIFFIAVYIVVIASWSMKADRYLLPILPAFMLLAATGFTAVLEQANRLVQTRRIFVSALSLLLVFMIASNLRQIRAAREQIQHDVRTDAQAWIEENVPAGSFIASENYGPDLIDPSFLMQMNPRVRTKLMKELKNRPLYALLAIPMYQVHPERSAPFYFVTVYADADYFVITRSIRGRYEKEPERFVTQLDFYAQLDRKFKKLKEFRNNENVELTIFATPGRSQPFAERDSVAGPPAISRDPTQGTGREAGFYFTLGANYEFFRHRSEAAASYLRALEYRTSDAQLFSQCVLGYARCLVALRRYDEASATLVWLRDQVDDPRSRSMIEATIQTINRSHWQ